MATFFASIFHSLMNEFNWIRLILTPRDRLLSTLGSEEMLGKPQPIAGNADVPSAPRQRRDVFSRFALSGASRQRSQHHHEIYSPCIYTKRFHTPRNSDITRY